MARRPLALGLALLTLAAAPAGMSWGVTLAPAAPPTAVPSVAATLALAVGPAADLPQVPALGLFQAVQAWDARLGVARAPGQLDILGTLDPALAAAVAHLLSALLIAAEQRDEAFAAVDINDLAPYILGSEDPAGMALVAKVDRTKMALAAEVVAQAVDEALPALQAYQALLPPQPAILPGTDPLVNLPPVLVLDPLIRDTQYHKDAVLGVDVGGNDVWDNNAGGGMIAQGPIGDPSTYQFFIGNVAIGGEFEDAGFMVTAALNIDLTGDDQYGVPKTVWSGSRDRFCTAPGELVVRRVVIHGAGSGGVGMLVDAAGNDHYIGKTLAIGHGHIAGIGVLVDATGDDTYQAIRSGPGSGVLGGVGVFNDAQGNDAYIFYAPLGGIFNADSGRCDATKRLGLGSAVMTSAAVFVEGGGDDVYHIDAQAFGFNSDVFSSTFADLGGTDDYGGYPGVGNGQHHENGISNFVDV